ncbi:hypothetical protein HBI22_247740 [Parastagonospora nodorum]|nr:hypothetical protein HBI22_247740 [Parastagonospora nodorum]
MAAVYTYNTASACLLPELGARHSLLNLSVHDLVEEFARHVSLSAAIICYIIVTELQHFGNEVETKDPCNTLTLTLSKTAQLRLFLLANANVVSLIPVY